MRNEHRKTKQVYRQGIFAVTYKREAGRIFYLLLKRKKHWKGWEFTKGGIEQGEKPIVAAKREVLEESGLKSQGILKFDVWSKYKYSNSFKSRGGYIGQTYQLLAIKVDDNHGKIKPKLDKKEHSAYKWLEFNQALKLLTWKNQKECLKLVDNSLKNQGSKIV